MIVHDRFVFLQARKTACTFMAEALQRELPANSFRTVGKHSNWAKIPPDAIGRPVLAYIRNPWDWYVSWYHYSEPLKDRNRLFWRLSAEGQLDFTATVSNACKLVAERTGYDLYTFFFRMSLGKGLDSDLLTIGRFESLVDDLERFLVGAGASLVNGGYERIRAMAPLNVSDRGPYQGYYSDELRDCVGASARPLIERFGYEF